MKIENGRIRQNELLAAKILNSDIATLRVHEAAAIARCNHKIIRRYVQKGLIPRLEFTRTILIPRAAFMRWLENTGSAEKQR